jgi:NTE family protein
MNGVFNGDLILDELDKYLGDKKFSDCKIPFIAVSVDLLTGKKFYHTKGFLKDAVRASCSIPLIFKPYELNGRFLVDGGLVECVPIEATKSIGAKKVIGINIEGFPSESEKFNLKNLASRVYHAGIYNIAKRDLKEADKKLSFDLVDYSLKELVDNAEKYIKMGYDETIELFTH